MTTTTSPPTSTRRASPKARSWPDWVGSWPRLKGRQEPEFESKFDGDESEGDRASRFGARIGMRPMPWQWLTLKATLSLQPPDEYGDRVWTHRDVAIECTRQQGKTLLIVLLILFHLFVLDTKRILYTAQRWSTAEDVFNRVWAVIDRVPSLRKKLAEKPTRSGNRGVIKLTNGAKVEFGPRSQDFGRGYTEVDLLFIDEAYDVDSGQEANLTGSQSAAKNPQTLYLSTPPVAAEHPKCQTLAGLHRLGHAHAPDLYYALYAAPRSMSRDNPEAWAAAQPSYGVATNEREIRSKRQKARSLSQIALFDADYMGWGDYPPDEAEMGSPISDEVWEAMVNSSPQLVGSRTIAVARSLDRRTWAVAAAQHTADGRVHLEIGPIRSAAHTEVAEYVVDKVTEWNPIALVMDAKSPAAEIAPLLLQSGVEPTITNTTDLARACGGFLDDALGGRLSHSNQPIFNDAVSTAVMREIPAGFAWDGSIPLQAATLAHWALLTFGKAEKAMPAKPRRAGATGATPRRAERDVMKMAF